MSAEMIAAIAGGLLSLGFSYIPGLSGWFERLGELPEDGYDNGTSKRLVMLGLLLLVSASVFGLVCSGWGEIVFGGSEPVPTCDQEGVMGLIRVLILAVMANQSIYQITPRVGVRE